MNSSDVLLIIFSPFVKLDKGGRLMIIIEKLKILHDVLNKNKKNKKPCMLPFLASQDTWTNKFLKNVFICKEALGTLFGIGCNGLATLVKHTVQHILPIHGLTGRVTPMAARFEKMCCLCFLVFLRIKSFPWQVKDLLNINVVQCPEL